jgi:hypothetical protein
VRERLVVDPHHHHVARPCNASPSVNPKLSTLPPDILHRGAGNFFSSALGASAAAGAASGVSHTTSSTFFSHSFPYLLFVSELRVLL